MEKVQGIANSARRTIGLAILLASMAAMTACQFDVASMAYGQTEGQQAASAQDQSRLVIENDSDLPDTYPHANYQLRFQVRGRGGGLHWHLEKGAIPPGPKLEEDGLLHGQPERTGEFQFKLSVWEGGHRDEAVEKGFTLRVRSAMMLDWKKYAHVNGSRIEGSAQVSNTTADDIVLTFDVKAVADNGRATEIGYQHFTLRRGTVAMELPFGENLPHGGYTIYVDAVGEVIPKNVIYREQMQTQSQLHVTVGP